MMAGEIAATVLSRIAVPVLYTVLARRFTLGAAREPAIGQLDLDDRFSQ
jgi:hypothetical protein